MRIIVSGGGIAGLTLALTAKQAGYIPLLIQQRDAIDKASFGGGIGLWPPSQMVMERLGILSELQRNGMYMPSACYYDSQGYILGHPSPDFHSKFPVVCLEREQLQKSLLKKAIELGIEIRTNTSVDHIASSERGVKVGLSTGEQIDGKVLIGADGINSKVRNFIMRQNSKPEVHPYHCEYAYFRAVLDLTDDRSSQWHRHAFESWGNRRRFGYVPLKAPKTFWFVAIPIGEQGLAKTSGSHLCSQQQKQWIIKQFQYWQAPINIKRLIELTPAGTILRTDICKVKDVTSFPWQSRNKNVIILGDAANATAPNLAQGAGLAIESAWDLISMVDLRDGKGLDQYMRKRKKRASTVQGLADLVAKIGQLPTPWNKVRNFSMRYSTHYLQSVQQRIFEQTVSHSVGGDSGKLHWLPPHCPSPSFLSNIRQQSCILGKIIGRAQFEKLPGKTRKFRASLVGEGEGKVSVSTLALAGLLGLPASIDNANFGAYCQTYFKKDGRELQRWTRVFGEGQKGAKKYSTVHQSTPSLGLSKTGLVLTQTLGIGPDLFRFGYLPKFSNKTIHYKSQGLWLRNYKLPIPNFLLPTSEWTETQDQKGWQFNGTISLPKIMGAFSIMRYWGNFEPSRSSREVQAKGKRVVIAGGGGMIGSAVAREFFLRGWNVEVLTRDRSKDIGLPFAVLHEWNPAQFEDSREIQRLYEVLKGADLIINLSGENPGSGLWTSKVKKKIIQSRLNSIKLISSALAKVTTKPPVYLQASAAGIYGDRKQQILSDNHEPGPGNAFRIQTCKEIESLTRSAWEPAVVLRIGHVFSSDGGLLPHLELASKMRAGKFGRGGQYAPWVHIEDLASSFVHIAENQERYLSKTVNIASPNHHTYEEILSKMAQARGRRLCIVPVPEKLLRVFLGEISSVLLDSQRMHPQKLLDSGFQFKYADIEKALTSRKCL